MIVQLLSAYEQGLDVRILIRGGAILGLSSNRIRVTLARMKQRGLVESTRRGQYRIGPSAAAINAYVVGWRAVDSRIGPWNESWLAVQLHAGPRAERRRSERALMLAGLARLWPGVFIRPNNLIGTTDDHRKMLYDLGLSAGASVYVMNDLDPNLRAQALALWDTAQIDDGYTSATALMTKSLQRLPKMDDAEAAKEAFEIGGDTIRRIVLDPLLPEPLVDGQKRKACVAQMIEYDTIGRQLWAKLMLDEQTPHVASEAVQPSTSSVGDRRR